MKKNKFYGIKPSSSMGEVQMPQTQDHETMCDLIMELPAVIDMDLHDQHALSQRLRGQSVTELDRIYAELTQT